MTQKSDPKPINIVAKPAQPVTVKGSNPDYRAGIATTFAALTCIAVVAGQHPLRNFSVIGKVLEASNVPTVEARVQDAANLAQSEPSFIPSSAGGANSTNMIGSTPSPAPKAAPVANKLVFNTNGFKRITTQPILVTAATAGKDKKFELYSKQEDAGGKIKKQFLLVPAGSIKGNATGTSYLVLTQVQGMTTLLVQPYGELTEYTLHLSVTNGSKDLILSYFLGTVDPVTNKTAEPILEIGTSTLPVLDLNYGQISTPKFVK
jgi:hypothetical protein